MKKITLFVGLFLCFAITACNYFRSDSDRFAETYRRVLINREMCSDSLTANRKMLEILDEQGYNIDSFHKVYMELAKDKPDEFMSMLDTMRQSVAKEIIEYRKKHDK